MRRFKHVSPQWAVLVSLRPHGAGEMAQKTALVYPSTGVVETGREQRFCLRLPNSPSLYQGRVNVPPWLTSHMVLGIQLRFRSYKQALYLLNSLPSPIAWSSCFTVAIKARTTAKTWTGQHRGSCDALAYF